MTATTLRDLCVGLLVLCRRWGPEAWPGIASTLDVVGDLLDEIDPGEPHRDAVDGARSAVRMWLAGFVAAPEDPFDVVLAVERVARRALESIGVGWEEAQLLMVDACPELYARHGRRVGARQWRAYWARRRAGAERRARVLAARESILGARFPSARRADP